MEKISTMLWFDHQAEEAAKFYASIFQNSKVGKVARYGESAAKASGQPAGSVMTVEFELDGRKFVALNGGPVFKFTEAISFVAHCKTQEEVNHLWESLSQGGAPGQCGWLKDRYGVSWQVVPDVLIELLQDKDPATSRRVMQAMLQMNKIDIAALRRAHAGN